MTRPDRTLLHGRPSQEFLTKSGRGISESGPMIKKTAMVLTAAICGIKAIGSGTKGKYGLPGLPAVYADEEEAETLEILMEDAVTKVQAVLLYGVEIRYHYEKCQNHQSGGRYDSYQ